MKFDRQALSTCGSATRGASGRCLTSGPIRAAVLHDVWNIERGRCSPEFPRMKFLAQFASDCPATPAARASEAGNLPKLPRRFGVGAFPSLSFCGPDAPPVGPCHAPRSPLSRAWTAEPEG